MARPSANFQPGGAFVVSGKTGSPARSLYWKGWAGQFGRSLAAVGDANGDKVIDFAVGMLKESHGSRGRGAVRVFSGKDQTLLAPFIGDDPGDVFGFSIAWLGDVSGDKNPDLVAGSSFDDDNGPGSGSASVVSISKLPLMSRTRSVSILRRETQVLDLDAGPGNAGKIYLVLGTAGSIRP
ncbi:MAG: integrin alpha [Planctomycetota bacterium]